MGPIQEVVSDNTPAIWHYHMTIRTLSISRAIFEDFLAEKILAIRALTPSELAEKEEAARAANKARKARRITEAKVTKAGTPVESKKFID
jgi:hypothetical protein